MTNNKLELLAYITLHGAILRSNCHRAPQESLFQNFVEDDLIKPASEGMTVVSVRHFFLQLKSFSSTADERK